jgi:hypothetical protein
MIIVLTPESPIIRSVFARCDLDDGHFMWTGATSKGGGKSGQPGDGYPSVWVPELKRTVRGHRLIFAAFHGYWDMPPGFHREHVCNRSLCLNPACMELVTAEENQRRKVWRDRARKEGQPLICPACKEAGDMIPALREIESVRTEPTVALVLRREIEAKHAECPGGNWCACQHVIPEVEPTGALELVAS